MCRQAIIQRGVTVEVNILWLYRSFLTPPPVWQIIPTLQGVMPMPNLPKIVLITPDPRQIAATPAGSGRSDMVPPSMPGVTP
jgi:hypothetical protein